MKGITLFALMTAGFILFAAAAIGVAYAKHDEVTTTVVLEDGITCTINGKAVSNGDKVTVKSEGGYLNVHVESNFEQGIGYAGTWQSVSNTVTSSCTDNTVSKCGDFKIAFNHGEYNGRINIQFFDGDGDLAAINLTFTITGDISVSWSGGDITNGQTVSFPGDSKITVKTNDGQRHEVSYSGSWSNPDGMSGGASGGELNSTVIIDIVDCIYFDPATGTMNISVS